MLNLFACAASPPTAGGSAPQVVRIEEPSAPPPPLVPDAGPRIAPQEIPSALARAYATDDARTIRTVAEAVLAREEPDAGDDTDRFERYRKEKWARSEDDERFAAGMQAGLFLGQVDGPRIQAFLPEFAPGSNDPTFVADAKLVVLRRGAPVGSDSCRLTWAEKDQARFWVVDFATHQITLDRRGRVVGASSKTLLLSDGAESKLSLYDVETRAERPVSFDPTVVRGNPLPWKPKNCGSDCTDVCTDGAPAPWDLRHGDVTFSSDGATMALNWNGFSRGIEQGVSVHDTQTGAMIGSFVSMTPAKLMLLPASHTVALLLASKKSKAPYHSADTLVLFDGDKRIARAFTECTFASGRLLHLGVSRDGTRVFVRWDFSGKEHDSEACEFDAAAGRFVGKLHAGDARFDDVLFDDHREPISSARVARSPARHLCSRGGYLFPESACVASPPSGRDTPKGD